MLALGLPYCLHIMFLGRIRRVLVFKHLYCCLRRVKIAFLAPIAHLTVSQGTSDFTSGRRLRDMYLLLLS